MAFKFMCVCLHQTEEISQAWAWGVAHENWHMRSDIFVYGVFQVLTGMHFIWSASSSLKIKSSLANSTPQRFKGRLISRWRHWDVRGRDFQKPQLYQLKLWMQSNICLCFNVLLDGCLQPGERLEIPPQNATKSYSFTPHQRSLKGCAPKNCWRSEPDILKTFLGSLMSLKG